MESGHRRQIIAAKKNSKCKHGFGSPNGNIVQVYKQKNHAHVFNTFRAAQKQARYQYSGEFTSVFQ